MAALAVPDLVTLLGATIALSICWYAWRNRSEPGARGLAIITAGAATWLAADTALVLATTPSQTRLLSVLYYVGVSTTVLGWILLVLEFAGYRQFVTRRTVALFLVEPVTTPTLAATNPWHGLFWQPGLGAETVRMGPAHLVHTAYVYVAIAVGVVLLLRKLFTAQTLYPSQIYLVVAGALLPALVDVLVLVAVVPPGSQNLALVGTCLLLTLGLFRHKFLRLAPVADGPLIENLRDGVFVLDRDGRFVELNPTATRLLGGDDLQGAAAAPVLGSHEAFANHGDRILTADEEESFEVEYDDQFFDVLVTPLRDHRGQLVARQVQLHDITEQKRREQELSRQNERLDEFASVVSHDLRNPMNVAQGRTELALETGDRSHLDDTMAALDRMETIVEDVLTLARDGRTIDDTDPVALGSAAESAWNHVETGDATLIVEDDLIVAADPDRTHRLFENLFRNAVEHGSTTPREATGDVFDGSTNGHAVEGTTADGESVTVIVGTLADEPGFFVADDGPGIPESDRDRVLDHGFTTDEDGTGFGLAIVANIADAHDWTPTVTESRDGGARFEFRDVTVPADPSSAESSD